MTSEDPSSELGPSYEATHVHAVYEEIASHFSSTRYKPWPIVEHFLKELPDGAVGADIGCGNGKYMAVNNNIFILGSDRNHKHHTALQADTLSLPHPRNSLDFAISIAVIHHLSTPERRIEAVRCILDVLRRPTSRETTKRTEGEEQDGEDGGGVGQADEDGGRALIYVWALEQKDSRRGWDEGCEQDVMVPWVMKGTKQKERGKRGKKDVEESSEMQEGSEKKTEDKTFLRYYHLYRKGELEGDIEAAGGRVVEAGYEKDNWWAVASLR